MSDTDTSETAQKQGEKCQVDILQIESVSPDSSYIKARKHVETQTLFIDG